MKYLKNLNWFKVLKIRCVDNDNFAVVEQRSFHPTADRSASKLWVRGCPAQDSIRVSSRACFLRLPVRPCHPKGEPLYCQAKAGEKLVFPVSRIFYLFIMYMPRLVPVLWVKIIYADLLPSATLQWSLSRLFRALYFLVFLSDRTRG